MARSEHATKLNSNKELTHEKLVRANHPSVSSALGQVGAWNHVFLCDAGIAIGYLLGWTSDLGGWIPLCFFMIPPIHYLCREVVTLRRKLEEIEKRLGE